MVVVCYDSRRQHDEERGVGDISAEGIPASLCCRPTSCSLWRQHARRCDCLSLAACSGHCGGTSKVRVSSASAANKRALEDETGCGRGKGPSVQKDSSRGIKVIKGGFVQIQSRCWRSALVVCAGKGMQGVFSVPRRRDNGI